MPIKVMESNPQRLLAMAKDFRINILQDQPIAVMQAAIISAYLQELDRETRRIEHNRKRKLKNVVGIDSDFDF